MVDGRHFENRYIAISQRKIIRFRWNFVHISRFWTGWTSRDQKWKSRIGQTPSSTEHISCSMWMLCVLSCASKSDLCDYDDMRKIKKHLFSLHIIGLPLCSLSISSRQNICLVANIFMLFMYEQIQSRNFRLGRAQLETGRAGPGRAWVERAGRGRKNGPVQASDVQHRCFDLVQTLLTTPVSATRQYSITLLADFAVDLCIIHCRLGLIH